MRQRLPSDFHAAAEDPSRVAVLDREIASDRAADTGALRFLVRSDIPALVALRQRVFRRSERSSPAELAAYLERVFFDSPMGTSAAHESLVHEDAAGRLTGFLGVIPRRMFLGNRSIQVHVGTQLMVAPDAPGLVGRRLVRALCDGSQDLVLADTANDAARRLWDSIGGHTAVSYSLSWFRALRPVRFATMRVSGGFAARATLAAARPAVALVDMLSSNTRSLPQGERGDSVIDLDVGRDLPTMHTMLQRWELRPGYTAEMLRWVLEQVELKRPCGRLRMQLVQEGGGRPLGWFMYCVEEGGIGQVLQVGSRRHMYGRVLTQLFRDAHALGAVGLVGRLEPSAAADLSAAGAQFTHDGPWTLAYTRDRSLLGVIESGRAFLSRLDGEWWLAF